MSGDVRNNRGISDFSALELRAAGAGYALACPFSSSDEFEADLISSRRAAGLYGSRSHTMHMIATAAGLAAAVAVLLLVVI